MKIVAYCSFGLQAVEYTQGLVSKKIFSALWTSVWSKKKGGMAPRAPPLDPPLIPPFVTQ